MSDVDTDTDTDTDTSSYSTVDEYISGAVMPAVEGVVFSEAVALYKANERTAGWIKQMEQEEE